MRDNTKPNDWFIAMQDNPTFNMTNFKDVGLTPDNTGLKDKNTYRNSKYVQEKFTNTEGAFDEASFDKFYQSAAESYQAFANNQYEDDILSDVEFDPFNAIRPAESKTKEIKFAIERVPNPNRLKTGMSRIGRTDDREWTISELAQREKVFDYEKGEFKDYNPNDNTLFGNPMGFLRSLSEPLVIAQWDEAGEHIEPFSGRKVKHNKGDYKYNEDGSYYYETLGRREVYGKQFKSMFDSITVDGSKGNKYDFFDSDSLDKSVTGTVMKTAVTLAPLFIPGVNAYYGGALIGAQLFDILPTIYKSTLGIHQDTPTFNLIQGMGKTFKSGVSEYSQEHLVSTENFFNLVTDVALQWAQQRAIFKGVHKLLGTEKMQAKAMAEASQKGLSKTLSDAQKGIRDVSESVIKQNTEMAGIMATNKLRPLLEKRNRTAANLALGYMAMLSGLDSYQSAIEQGVDREAASLVAWGTVAGMYAVDRTGLGEIFFPELKGDQEVYRKAITSVGDEITKGLNTIAKQDIPRKHKLSKLFDWSKKKSSRFWSDMKNHSLGFFGKAVGEGLEEVAEELVSDFAKSTYNVAAEFGYTKTNQKLDAWDDWAARYGMSFFGGAIGGAIFQGVDIVQNLKNPEALNQELIYLVRNGRTSEMLKELDELRKKGKLGNRNLSSTKYELSKDGNQNLWQSPTSVQDNQNEAAYRMIRSYIQSVDAVINQQGLHYSDDQLLDKMVMGDIRMRSLMETQQIKDKYNGRFLQDFNTTASEIVSLEAEIRAEETRTDKAKREEKKQEQAEQAAINPFAPQEQKVNDKPLEDKRERLKELYAKRDKFLDGTYSAFYTDQMLFAIDGSVNTHFYNSTFQDYVEFTTKKKIEDLSEAEAKSLQSGYEEYIKSSKDQTLDTAYAIYKTLNKKLSTKLEESSVSYEEYAKLRELLRKELINIDETKAKLASTLNKDINEVQTWIDYTDARQSIKPVINPHYQLPNSFEFIEGESEEGTELRRQAYEAERMRALTNINNLLDQISVIGFIDIDTRNLILDVIGNPENSSAIRKAESKLLSSGALSDYADYMTPYNELKKALPSLTTKKEDLDQLLTNIHDWVYSDEGLKSVRFAMAEAEEFGNDPLTEDIRQKNLEKELSALAKETYSEMLSDPVISTANRLKDQTIALKNSPIYEFAQEFATNTYGKKLTIFDIIEEENRRFEAAPTPADYVLDGNRKAEIEQGLKVLGMMQALINAANTVDLDTTTPFGHNQVMNDFLQNNFPKEELYGIIKSDLAAMMSEDLRLIYRQLSFLKELSDLNAINQFSEHKKTGKNVTRLFYDVLRGKNEYGFLQELSFEGHKLFDGLDEVDTPNLDAIDSIATASDDIYTEADKLYDRVYDNFQNIVQTTGKNPVDVFKGLFSDIKNKFGENALLSQKNTSLNSRTEKLEDYDVYMFLASLISLRKSDFNYYLREILSDPNIDFAPLFSQEYASQIAIAMIVNPDIMGSAIDGIESQPGEKGEELLKYRNMLMINGIGGAGKTSVIAKLIYRISKKLYPDMTIWKAGPTEEQSRNLSLSLNAEGEEYTIEGLVKQILGDENYGKLANDIKNGAKESDFYKLATYKHTAGGKFEVAVATPVEYSKANLPKVVFIDETTHMNSIYAQHLSNWAAENGVTIVNMGDLFQNGYYNGTIGAYNVSPQEAIMVRTPKLDISMRVTNIQAKDNVQVTVKTLESVTMDESMVAQADSYISQFKDAIKRNMVIKYYEDEQTPLNGVKIINAVTREEVQRLIDNSDEIGYVYDDESSETYKLLNSMIKDNPSLANKIKFFTPKSVQGSERKYFIIDVDFGKYDLDYDASVAEDFMVDFYTMMTRSREGALFIDRGLSKNFDSKNLIKSDNTSFTPDPTKIIEDFKSNKIDILNNTLGDYLPQLRPEDVDEDRVPEKEPESAPAPSTPPAAPTVENAPESTETPDPAPWVVPTGEPLTGDTTPDVKEVPSELSNVFLGMLETGSDITDKDISGGPMSGIRAYGWYMRYGAKEEVVDGVSEYTRLERPDGVIDDLNVFMFKNKKYYDSSMGNQKKMLNTVRNYLTYGIPFDENFINLLKTRGFNGLSQFGGDEQLALDVWNSGEFKLEVRRTNEAIDKARDKNGYDAKLVEDVSFNVVYRFKLPDFVGGATIQFTLGKLAKPETWNVWLTNNKVKDAKILNTYNNYSVWYKQKVSEIGRNPDSTLYYDLPKDQLNFSAATRLKQVPEGESMKRFNLEDFNRDHPNALRSPVYIYSGSKGLLNKGKNGNINGKAIMFVTANPDLVIDGEKVTPENLASMYIKLNLDKENTTPLIRMVVLEPKGFFVSSNKGTSGYFDMSFKDLASNDSDRISSDQIAKFLSTYGGNTTAAKMVVSMWNYRAGLGRFLDAVENYAGEGDVNVNTFNNFMNNDPSLFKNEFRLLADSPDRYDMQVRNIPQKDGKNVNGVFITRKQADTQFRFLNEILKMFGELIELPADPKAARYSIRTSSADGNSPSNEMNSILKSLLEDKYDLTFSDGTNTFTHAGFKMEGSYKVISIMSAIYQAFGTGRENKTYTIRTSNKNNTEAASVNITRALQVLRDSMRANGIDVKPITFVKGMYNMIFHGKVNPYIDASTGGVNVRRSYAPFPYGIFYHPRYQVNGTAPVSDFYPALNVDSQFTYNVAIENSNFEISIDPTKLKQDSPIKLVDTRTRQDELELRLGEITTNIAPYMGDMTNIEYIINQFRNDYISGGDPVYDTVMKQLIMTVNNQIESQIRTGKFIKDNDMIFSAKFELEGGVLHFKVGDTLFNRISKIDSALIPLNPDGSVDTTQIQNVEYSGSNNENFSITLQNGNSVKGKINGTKVEIEQTRLYTLQLDQTQRDEVVKNTFDAIKENNLPLPEVSEFAGHLLGISEDANLISDTAIRQKIDEIIDYMEENAIDYLDDFPELADFLELLTQFQTAFQKNENLTCAY